MNEEIKELFNKYGVKDLKDKNGQSECNYLKGSVKSGSRRFGFRTIRRIY